MCEPKNRVKGLFDILGNTYERREKHVFRVYVGALIPPLKISRPKKIEFQTGRT
jgi:hypothetical protein